MGHKITSQIISFVFTVSSLSAAPAQYASAIELNLNRGIVARESNEKTDVLDRVGYLRPGTQIRIPERFSEGQEDGSEATIMRWLSQSGDLRQFSIGGGKKADYYLPVEIVTATNSSGVEVGAEVYVPIRFLVRSKGLSLEVTEETQAIASDETDRDSNALRGPFISSDRDLEQVFIDKVQKYLKAAEAKAERNTRNRQSADAGQVNFDSTCPISFEDFREELEKVSARNFIPSELLLSIMHLESVGRCYSYRKEWNGSASIGLFQVNTNTSSVPGCSWAQLKRLKKTATLEGLKDPALRCLQNPIANLGEAAKILRQKYAYVNVRKQPAAGRWYRFERQARDDWRKALSAYSGGQGYVYQAYNDIVDFNKRNNTDFDPDNWEHRRLFFFRQILEAKIDKRYFGRAIKHRRTLGNVLTNMAYVESIVGREGKPEDVPNTLIFRWIKELYQVPTRV